MKLLQQLLLSLEQLTKPAPSQVCLKSKRNGVSNPSRANVWSPGIVALNANKAPTWITTNKNPASNNHLILVANSIGVALLPFPISNNTKWIPATTNPNNPAETSET